MRLKNKTAIITGGGSGIGLACAQAFVQEGANVTLFGRRQNVLDQAVQDLGTQALAVPGDVSKPDDCKALVKATVSKWGSVDILVNNAGTFVGSPIHEMADEQWDQVLDINLRSVFILTKYALNEMLKNKSGNIINISSILGLVATPGVAAYNASKGALNQFTRSIAVEYGSQGIRSNTICPGLIATDLTRDLMNDKELMDQWRKNYPIGRFGIPEDVAGACLFLASDESSFITGATLPVDGGYTAL